MASAPNSSPNISDQIRSWIPVIITAGAVLVSIVLWAERNGEDKYFTKESGENMKEKIADMKIDMQQIKQQNMEIIQRLSALDAKVAQAQADRK
jgi:nitrogen fixation-related uncharacterized protein